jgi:hypothetical protein
MAIIPSLRRNKMIHIFEDKKPTLEEAQSLVDGYVEMVRSPVHGDIQILVNEEGLLKGLDYNKEASETYGTGIVGDAVVLKGELGS